MGSDDVLNSADSDSVDSAALPSLASAGASEVSDSDKGVVSAAGAGRKKGMAEGSTVKMSPGLRRVLGLEH
jgi:hypothetical protein